MSAILLLGALLGAVSPGSPREMMNVAHRGLWKEAGLPQNTVEAIRAAYEAGAQVVETDFNETDSGEIICLHDRNALATMSSVVREPKEITPADRAVIDLGEKMKLPRPYRIPLLADVLAVVPKTAVLQAEIKTYGPTYAQKFDAAVRAAGLTETNVVVSSFQYEALRDFHTRYPAYRTLWLYGGLKKGADLGALVAKAKAAGFDVFCPGAKDARNAGFAPSDADRVRAAGLDFRVYGVNDPSLLAYAASLGATGFTCNYHLAAYGWARKIPGVRLLPDRGALIPDDFKGCLSETVRTVGVVMPASIPNRADYLRCKAWLEYAGYRVKEPKRLCFARVAPVADRVADFEEMWMDPEVDLVMAVRGGRGAEDLIGKIDWAKLRTRNSQRVLGFSNITYLLNTMLREKAGHPISGPSLTQFRYLQRPSLDWLRRVLAGDELPPQALTVLRPGACAGLPCGGHIAMLRGLAERRQLPDANGRIVFLECSVRDPKVVVRELDAIAASGWLTNAAGVVFGDITPGDAKSRRLTGAALEAGRAEVRAIKRAFAARMTCPVFDDYDYGHVPLSFAIDFERPVDIRADGTMTYRKARASETDAQRGASVLRVSSRAARAGGDSAGVVYDNAASRATVAYLVKDLAKRSVGANNRVLLDQPYYPAGTPMDAAGLAKCRMDFRYPTNAPGFRTLVWFHSGGLDHGRRHWVALADTNIAQITVSYRLLGQQAKRGEDCIEDAAAAVAWALKNVASCGGDPTRVYVAGHSAGAYLSMMVGMDPRWLAKWGFKPTDLAGICPISGQATAHFNVRHYAGDGDPQFRPKIDDLSALRYVGKDLPPILSICGQPPYEWEARAEENRFLIASCKAFGHRNARYVELPLANHHRACACGLPYLELFIRDGLPADLETKGRE